MSICISRHLAWKYLNTHFVYWFWHQTEKLLTNNEEEYRLTCLFIHSFVFQYLRDKKTGAWFDKQTPNSKLNLFLDFCISSRQVDMKK